MNFFGSKMKIRFLVFVIFLMTGILGTSLFAQTLSDKEQALAELEKNYARENSTLNLLQKEMDTAIKELDRVKNETPRDESKIQNSMARAFEISARVDNQSKKVDAQANLVKNQRRVLYNIYSHKIDSLSFLADASNDKSFVSEMDEQIKKLNGKRVHVSPLLPLFSFDPRLISKISLNNSADSLENSIFSNYLNRALSEVDSNIFVIKMKGREARQAMNLKNRTEEFLEDIDDSQIYSTFDKQNRSFSVRESYDNDTSPLETQLKDINIIFTQLQPVLTDNLELPRFVRADSIAIEDYVKLLDDTEKTLKLYREIIKKKMD